MPHPTDLDRRGFLTVAATSTGGLLLGVRSVRWARGIDPDGPPVAVGLTAFVEVGPDGAITIAAKSPEIGQGVKTSLPMLVAEELDVDWERVRVSEAPFDEMRFGSQGVGGSTSIWENWLPLRRAGATARYLLVAAAAARWRVDPSTLRTEAGSVLHPQTGRRASYGALAAAAARLPVPAEVPLKSPRDFRLIGRRIAAADIKDLVTGRARYGIDGRVPGMRHACIARAPFGGRVKDVHDSAALEVPGVLRVIPIEGSSHPTGIRPGVAIVADSTWAAIRGRTALGVIWEEAVGAGTADFTARLTAAFETTGKVVRDDGDVEAAFAAATRTVEALYDLPFLAHVPLEPPNCIADVRADRCEVWVPTQDPGDVQAIVAETTGLPPDQVTVHPTRCGGGFGRRLMVDYAGEAALLSQRAGAPVQVVWTREDDLTHDFYRPACRHRLRAALDPNGRVTAWTQHLVNPSRYAYAGATRVGPEASEMYADDFPAGCVPNLRYEYTNIDTPIPRGAWRSTLHSANAFAVESFMDEVAATAGRDPLAFRLEWLGEPRELQYRGHGGPVFNPGRLAGVLRLAAEKAGWGTPLGPGRARGLAGHFTFGSYAAEVIEVSLDPTTEFRVERIVAALDCGTVVNRSGAEAQVEGGILEGLCAALYGEITVERGWVRQTNFDTYRWLRIGEAPRIEAHFVENGEAPRGLGEPPVPPVAPALTNALFALTGRRIRRLPLRPGAA
ncbi:MAG TPA: molybdopterin cofactor-binding domain-containing protein [Gemmatimonadales bacterium]|nr:molybdopterin cofactor-binding domain-containing protein [Gemmatimonadales bacterium]